MSRTEPIRVFYATGDQRHQVAAVLAAAFHDDPLGEWLVPNADERPTTLRRYADEMFGAAAKASGHIHLTTPVITGAAIWREHPHPAGNRNTPPTRDETDVMLRAALGADTAARITTLDTITADYTPTRPHHHLVAFGVLPDQQRRGVGTAVLRYHLTHLDTIDVLAYTIATGPASRELLLRHGFTELAAVQPTAGPPLWPMVREPHTAYINHPPLTG